MLAYALSLRGYDVTAAADGLDGVDLGMRRPFDAVVSDLTMPGLDGLATLDRFRDNRPSVAFIVMTGYATPETAAASLARGAAAHLAKPFEIDQLCQALERALESTGRNGVPATGENPVDR